MMIISRPENAFFFSLMRDEESRRMAIGESNSKKESKLQSIPTNRSSSYLFTCSLSITAKSKALILLQCHERRARAELIIERACLGELSEVHGICLLEKGKSQLRPARTMQTGSLFSFFDTHSRNPVFFLSAPE